MKYIAEIGLNHNGDIKNAKTLIELSKQHGWDYVKFQKRNPEECVSKDRWYEPRETPWGMLNYIDYRHKLEFGEREYDIIDEKCKELDIEWFASVWDFTSQRFIEKYGCPYTKIPSFKVTDIELVQYVASHGIPTFLSAGTLPYEVIDKVVDVFKMYGTYLALFHSVNLYPTPKRRWNLDRITELEKYHVDLGYSGHYPNMDDVKNALKYNIKYVEKHVTLDKNSWGTDHKSSVYPNELEK